MEQLSKVRRAWRARYQQFGFKIIITLLLTAALMWLLLLLWTRSGAHELYNRALLRTAAAILPAAHVIEDEAEIDEYRAMFSTGSITRFLTMEERGENFVLHYEQLRGQTVNWAEVGIEIYALHFGLLVLTALLITAPDVPWRRRLLYLPLGWLLMLIFHFLVIALEAWLLNIEVNPATSTASWWWRFRVAAVRIFWTEAGGQFVPIAIWLALTARHWLPAGARERLSIFSTKTISPDAPCPCGSGKSFRECCGK